MTHSTQSILAMSGDVVRLPMGQSAQLRAAGLFSSFRSGAIIGAPNPMEPPPAPYGRNKDGKSQLSPNVVRSATVN